MQLYFEVELCQVKMDPTRLKKLAEERLTLLRRICCTFTLMLAHSHRHIITHRVYRYYILLPQWNLQTLLYCVFQKSPMFEDWDDAGEGVRPAEAAADVIGVAGVCFEMNETKRYSKMDPETLELHHKCKKMSVLSIFFGESSPCLAVRSSYCPGFVKWSSEFGKPTAIEDSRTRGWILLASLEGQG